MQYLVHDGHGRPAGYLEWPEILEGTTDISIETKNWMLVLPIRKVIPFGWCVQTKWKQRERLKRAGLLIKYKKRWWPYVHDGKEKRYWA